ncbi:MAG: hypothetical protein H6667_20200 [Ardenticatenaceae bacterium]|nr:hypothetical protein [Ardenticatenaceae bacterium]
MSFADLFSAFRWWAALMIIGAAATPLTLLLFRRLPDRGYAFAKLVGLLIVSYLFWMLGSLGLLGNNLGGILLAFLVLVGLSIWAVRRLETTRLETRDYETNLQSPVSSLQIWLRQNRSQIIITELLFAVLFAVWVWVRAQNPAIAATEKPMEFAFLNGIGRSDAFPPVDPWLSGFAISYYYFGYVMVSVLARVTAVSEPIAFNLAIAWLVAATGTAAFGLVYNLVMGLGMNRKDAKGAENEELEGLEEDITPSPLLPFTPAPRSLALLLGLIAAIALPIAGNWEIGLEVLHASGAGSDQFWQWLDVRDLEAPAIIAEPPRYESTAWWWWRSSRVIHEYHLNGRAEDGLEPIAEFPGFSFLLGDMHPHVLALPFAFLSLAVAYLWYLIAGEQGSGDQRSLGAGEQESSPRHLVTLSPLHLFTPAPLLLFTTLLLGGLAFLNTWDVLIHLFVVVGAYVLGRWQTEGWKNAFIGQAFRIAVGLVAALFVMYLPFFLGFKSQAGAPYILPMLMRPTRLTHFLIIFCMPLFSITILVVVLAVRQRFRFWRAGMATAVSLLLALFLLMLLLGWIVAASAEGSGQVVALANDLGLALPAHPESGLAFGWGLTAVFTLLPAILKARLAYPAMTIFLLTLLALVVMIWTYWSHTATKRRGDITPSLLHPFSRSPLPFLLLLVASAILLTLGPEFVYLRDNFGQRLNTIFKFYYQAWVMFGVAGLVGLAYLWHTVKAAGVLASIGYGLALLVALLFPFYGIQSRAAEYRGAVTAESRQPATLNGLAQVERFKPDEYEAIMWLRENVEGTPTIVEAVGGQYTEYGRFAANTGIPTILGWAGHEYQWRGDTPEPGQREPAVREIYTGSDWDYTVELLNQYDVEYIIIGSLELSTYGPQIIDKFAGLDIAFSNNGVVVYHWEPE